MIEFVDKTGRTRKQSTAYEEVGSSELRFFAGKTVEAAERNLKVSCLICDRAVARTKDYLKARTNREFELNELPRPPVQVSRFSNDGVQSIFFKKNEIILGLKIFSAIEVARLCVDYGLTLLWFDPIGVFGLFRHSSVDLNVFYKKFEADQRILFAEPNVLDGAYFDNISDLEEDSTLSLPLNNLWNHEIINRSGGWSIDDGKGVIVAVVDTPIMTAHSGFSGSLIGAANEFHFGEGSPIPNAHGTAVTSIICDQTKTPYGATIGLAPSARILPISIDTSGTSSYPRRALAINFLAKSVRMKVLSRANAQSIPLERLVVNCSWQLQSSVDLTSVALAFDSLVKAGAICVCSAGNSNSANAHYPSDYEGCVSVTGIDQNKKKWLTPGLPGVGANFGARIDFAMPCGDGGVNRGPEDILAAQDAGSFGYSTGTSFAAPHASAILANLWSKNPELNNHQIVSLAKRSFCENIDHLNFNYAGQLGAGLLHCVSIN